MRDSERQTVFYLANGAKVLCIISVLLYKTLCTCDLPDAVLRQGLRIISKVEYLETAIVANHF